MKDPGKIEYAGKRYEATVPDTLDLAERAELALNGIGGTIDPDLHHQMFFFVHYAWKTPYMAHFGADATCDPKYAESFPLMRIMCGSGCHAEIEAAQRAEFMSRIEDGLYWNRMDDAQPWRAVYKPGFDGTPREVDLCNLTGAGRMLRALVTWRELSGDPAWDRPIRELVVGLARIAIRHDEYSYYPDGAFGEPFNYPRSGWDGTDEAQSETEGGEGTVVAYHGHTIQGLSRWYALSGDPEALDLATRLTRYCMLPRFWGGLPDPAGKIEGRDRFGTPLPDPACVAGPEQGHWYTHFHARAIGLRGILEYGMAVNDLRTLEFVQRGYEYALTFGIPRLGWLSCWPVRNDKVEPIHASNLLCEGCALGDMVALGIRLSDAGVGDYWDNVDSLVRNQLVEGQLVRADLLQAISDISPERPPEKCSPYPNQETQENVIARSLGNFAGKSTPTSIPEPWVMQCCTGNGTQGLYYGWEGIVREDGDQAQVNLLLNRAARSLDIDSYLPHEGKVVIHNKSLRRVSVRIPAWVARGEIRADVSGAARPPAWVGNYLMFDDLKPGDKIGVHFPINETTASYTAASGTADQQVYKCTFRGSTLVDISPRDDSPSSYPLYVRDGMRREETPLKETTRYVADRTILHW